MSRKQHVWRDVLTNMYNIFANIKDLQGNWLINHLPAGEHIYK